MKNAEATPNVEIWRTLFAKALALLDDLEKRVGSEVHWTFGGGTVLMLHYQHRVSNVRMETTVEIITLFGSRCIELLFPDGPTSHHV